MLTVVAPAKLAWRSGEFSPSPDLVLFQAGKRRTTLSDEEAATLGLIDAPILGCGTQGCAYAVSADRVVKLTRDPDDAMYAHVVMKLQELGGAEWAVPIYGIWELGTKKLWAIEAARATPLAPEDADEIGAIYDDTYKFETPEEWDAFYAAEMATLTGRPREILTLINEAILGFRNVGRDWSDFHSGNWAVHDGRLVVIDLGLSDPLEEPPAGRVA